LSVINVNGLKVSYEEAGDGLPIIFVPGLAESKECFSRQVNGLSLEYRTIAYDLRAGGAEELTIPLLVEDLAGFIDALRLHNAVICGHSFGGIIAQEFAIAYPHLTAVLALISSFPKLPQGSPERVMSWLTLRGARHTPIDWLRGLFGGKRAEGDSCEELAHQAMTVGRPIVDARLKLAQSFDSTDRLPEIAAPTLVIVGEKDREELQQASQALYDGINDSALEVIEGGDHFCFLERHDLVNAALDDFITSKMSTIS
jgi:3-oxoadipate enol-lactonase